GDDDFSDFHGRLRRPGHLSPNHSIDGGNQMKIFTLRSLRSAIASNAGEGRRYDRLRRLREYGQSRQSAFSLVETIGVVSLVVLLSGMLVPKVLQQMDQAARTKETADLSSISNAIVLQIFTSKTIPAASGLAQAVANWTRFPVSQIS